MAAESDFSKLVTKAMECMVCLDGMYLPYVLTCGHSLCLKCMKKLTADLCPSCRAPISLPGMRNYALQTLIDTLLKRVTTYPPHGSNDKGEAALTISLPDKSIAMDVKMSLTKSTGKSGNVICKKAVWTYIQENDPKWCTLYSIAFNGDLLSWTRL